jgi:hypothetical protein
MPITRQITALPIFFFLICFSLLLPPRDVFYLLGNIFFLWGTKYPKISCPPLPPPEQMQTYLEPSGQKAKK